MVQAPLRYPLSDAHLSILDALGSDDADRHRAWTTTALRGALGRVTTDSSLLRHLHSLCALGLVVQTPGRVRTENDRMGQAWSLTPRGLAVYTAALVEGHDPHCAPRFFVVLLP